MTRVESFDNLAPLIDSLNLMIKGVIDRETLYNKEDAELILEIMKARTLVECAGSLAVIADSLALGADPKELSDYVDELIKKDLEKDHAI